MKTPEGYEKDAIKKWLTMNGAWYFMPFMSGYGKGGVADIVACLRGVFWSIEVKREGKEPTPRQDTRMKEVRAAGGMATWGTAAKVIPELEAWLRANATSASAGPASHPAPPVAGSPRSG